MAVNAQTISTLYKKYLGRDPNEEERQSLLSGRGKFGQFSDPTKLESLLSNTSSSIKSKTLKRIDDNIKVLKGGTELFGGKLPDYTTFQGQNPELQKAQTDYDVAQENFGVLSQQAGGAPTKTRQLLKAKSYYFGEDRTDLEKRYSDPQSPFYIPSADAREQIISNAMQGKRETMQDTIQKVTDIYNTLVSAAQNETAAKKERVDTLLKTVEKAYDALTAYYGQEQANEFSREQAATEHGYRMQEIGASKSDGGTATERAEEKDRGYYMKNASLANEDALNAFMQTDDDFKQWFVMNRGIPYFQGGSSPEGKYTSQDLAQEYKTYQKELLSTKQVNPVKTEASFYNKVSDIQDKNLQGADITVLVQALINEFPEREAEIMQYFK